MGVLFLFSNANAGEVTKTVKVKLFFPRDGTENGQTQNGTQLRNWYYFWKDGNVVSDLREFNYRNANFYGLYSGGVLYVGNAAPKDNDGPIEFTNQYYKSKISSGANGIANSVAIVDDIQIISFGKGKPDTTAITAGSNGILDTTPSGDDRINSNTIITGANGICNTIALGDDVQIISINRGEPNSIIILPGPNDFIDTDPNNDDSIISGGLKFSIGANGKGIDCCAETCAHEKKHKAMHDDWQGQPDWDLDDVPDSEEGKAPYYFSPRKPDTYNLEGFYPGSGYSSYGDNEFLARVAESSPNSTNPTKDWSEHGKNW